MDKKILETLAENWKRCGIEKGDLVLVHSSLKRLMKKTFKEFGVMAKPQDVFDSLMLALGEEGTLVLPTYNFDFPESKFFDVRETPSKMGALTEIGRNHPGAVRTGHPIYSFVAIGKQAKEFEGIDNKSGYGTDSPFAKIQELGGKVSCIGLTEDLSMTTYHYVEEQNQVDYRFYKDFEGTYVDWKGNESTKTYSLYVRNIEMGAVVDATRMMNYLWEIGAYKGDKFDEGYGMRTITFKDMYNEIANKIQQGEAINFIYAIRK